MNLKDYQTLIFDCDGVILNSNQVKTTAFYNTALAYGEEAAKSLVNYHLNNGGISRYKKFELFLKEFIPKDINGPNLDELLTLYAEEVQKSLLTCEIAEDLDKLRQQTAHSKWLIISGGDQIELQEIFQKRGLVKLFDGGIFGSPDTKEQIFHRELNNSNIQQPAVFFGDSKYDYYSSTSVGIELIFLTKWSEVKDWEKFCKQNNISYFHSLTSLV